MTPFLVRYLVAWCAFCLLAAVLAVRELRVDWRRELRFLFVPWKVAVFAPAVLFVGFAGRFTDDETWDLVTGFGMALLTFFTAAWTVRTAWQVLGGRQRASALVVAVAVCLFASSWFYDGYLLWRDGHYTHRWLGNLQLSPLAYLCAGLLLNVERRGRGFGFAFTRPDPLLAGDGRVNAAMIAAGAPLVAIAAWVLAAYVGWHLP